MGSWVPNGLQRPPSWQVSFRPGGAETSTGTPLAGTCASSRRGTRGLCALRSLWDTALPSTQEGVTQALKCQAQETPDTSFSREEDVTGKGQSSVTEGRGERPPMGDKLAETPGQPRRPACTGTSVAEPGSPRRPMDQPGLGVRDPGVGAGNGGLLSGSQELGCCPHLLREALQPGRRAGCPCPPRLLWGLFVQLFLFLSSQNVAIRFHVLSRIILPEHFGSPGHLRTGVLDAPVACL